jgi:hypothetical protein
VPVPRPEPAGDLSLLQKQLILAQVQILELEDLRDELRMEVEKRAQALAELQGVADRALDESTRLQRASADAEAARQSSQGELQRAHAAIEGLHRETAALADNSAELQRIADEARASADARAARIGTLETELRALKSSRSWRWTAPLRSIERLFQHRR